MARPFKAPNQSLSGSLTNLTGRTTVEVASPVLSVISQQNHVKSYKHRILQTQIHSDLSLQPSKTPSHTKNTKTIVPKPSKSNVNLFLPSH